MSFSNPDEAAVLHPRPASSFFGAPVGDIEDLQPGSIAAIGVYCDHFCAGNPGGRFAARQMRYTSTVAGAGPRLASNRVRSAMSVAMPSYVCLDRDNFGAMMHAS